MKVMKTLSTISSLTVLDLSHNNLSDEIGMELAVSFHSNYSLEVLELSNNNFNASALAILQSLTKVAKLKVLNFEKIMLSEEACDTLVSVILKELNLQNTNLGTKAIDVLNALKTTSLNTLDLSYNNLPPDTCIRLSNVIQSNCSLENCA